MGSKKTPNSAQGLNRANIHLCCILPLLWSNFPFLLLKYNTWCAGQIKSDWVSTKFSTHFTTTLFPASFASWTERSIYFLLTSIWISRRPKLWHRQDGPVKRNRLSICNNLEANNLAIVLYYILYKLLFLYENEAYHLSVVTVVIDKDCCPIRNNYYDVIVYICW